MSDWTFKVLLVFVVCVCIFGVCEIAWDIPRRRERDCAFICGRRDAAVHDAHSTFGCICSDGSVHGVRQ